MAPLKIALVGVLGIGVAASLAFADHQPNHQGGGDTSLYLGGVLFFIGLVILIGLVAFGVGWLVWYVLRRSD